MQVSWIEADELKGLLARLELPLPHPAATPAAPAPVPPAEPEHTFLISGVEESVRDPFDALEGAASFVNSQPAVPEHPAALTAPSAPRPELNEDAALPLSRIRDKLRAIRQRASEAGMLGKASIPAPAAPPLGTNAPARDADTTPPPSPPPAAEKLESMPLALPAPVVMSLPGSNPAKPAPGKPAAFVPAGGTREERLAAFATWARELLQPNGGHLLVMDDLGELLWGGEARAGLVLSAMMACSASLRASAHAAFSSLPVMHQPLASGNVLTVIPCETEPGTLLHIAVAAPEALEERPAQELRKALVAAMRWKPRL